MNEVAAKDVVMVRAIETADRQQELLTQEDRHHASRSARELAQWRASETGVEPTAEYFLQQRATLILQRLAGRTPAFAAVLKQGSGLGRLAVFLPALALLAGAGLDRITDPHRVDLLSLPLLSIVAWNLLAYVALLVWLCLPRRSPGWTPSAFMKRVTGVALKLPRKLPHALTAGLSVFMMDWMQLSRPLMAARLARTLHLCAAMFAIGAIASLYLRGVMSAYVAGWESTFLTAQQLHGLLSAVFTPARLVFQLDGFSLADIEALRFAPSNASVANSSTTWAQTGARWVHLYAATILLLVITPRLLLALLAHWWAVRLTKRFPLPLEQSYFRQLGSILRDKPGVLRVLPYSFTVDEQRDKGLTAIAGMLLGEHSRVMLRPSNAYGEAAPALSNSAQLDDAEVDLTAVLFNLAATPEQQNHGEFIHRVVNHTGAKPAKPAPRGAEAAFSNVMVLVDESAYLERLGQQAGSAQRLAQRIGLWREFCHLHGASIMIVNLLDPSARPVDVESHADVHLPAGPVPA